MAGDIATLGLEVNAKGVEDANKQLDALAVKAGQAEKSAGDLNNSTKNLTGSLGGLGGALGKVASLMGIAFSVGAIKNAADAWSDMTARVDLAVGSQEKGIAVMNRLQAVARNTYSDINLTTESFLANSSTLRALGKSTQDALNYTEGLNNALVISGAKGERAASVQNALSKAMALGKLSGDNLNTVIAGGGEVVSLLAKELGVSELALRKMGAEGKITGKVMFDAVTKPLEVLRKRAGEMATTMGDAQTAISNMFTTIVGTVDKMTGSSGALAQAIYAVAYNISDYAVQIGQFFVAAQMVIQTAFDYISQAFSSISTWIKSIAGETATSGAIMAVGIGLATTAALGLAAAIIGPVVGALASLSAAILLNPIGLLVGAFAAVVAAAFIFRDEIADIVGVDIIDEVKRSVNIIIGAFVAAYKTVVKYWENLPQAFSIIGKKAWNAFVGAFEGESLWIEAFGQKFTLFDGLDLSKFKADIKDDAVEISDDISAIWNTETSKNWAGELKGSLKEVWTSAAEVADKFKEIDTNLGGDGTGVSGALGDADTGGGGKGRKDSAAEKLKKEMDKRLEVLTDSLRAEEDLKAAQYLKDLETLEWARENEKISQEQYNQYKLDVERKFQDELMQIKGQELSSALNATADFFGAMSSLQAGGNEKMLKAQKIFAAASALVNTYLAASQALADPTLGFWGKFAAVAAVVAKGISLVAAIKSGSKGSSGGGGGGAGASTPTAAAPEQKPISTQAVEINLHGEVYSKQAVADLMSKMNDMTKDGFQLNIRTT